VDGAECDGYYEKTTGMRKDNFFVAQFFFINSFRLLYSISGFSIGTKKEVDYEKEKTE
jgi:hypothetical protein